ncbi:MAG: mycothiol synthase [Actinobacteria bacterium]|nr:MAG: mycothiol synthase [Actinomycetota bacterium]
MAHLDIKRRSANDDFSEVDELLRAAERADGVRPLSDHLWIDLRQGGRPGFAGLLAWAPGHDHLVAYCQVSRGDDSWSLDLVVHPHHRYDMASIGPELLAAAVEMISQEGGGHVHWWVYEPTQLHHQLASSIDFTLGRTNAQMRVALPLTQDVLASTTPIETCAFRVGTDEDAWLDVNNRAFSDHPEQGSWTRQTLESRQHEPWFSPNGFLLHHINSKLAGFCWTKLHLDTQPVLGEIYVVAVDPDFAGKGLGRSLTVAGLQHLSRLKTTVGMLHVDAQNTRALGMYNSLGFTAHHQQCAFVGDVH